MRGRVRARDTIGRLDLRPRESSCPLIIDAKSFSPAARLSRKAALDGVLGAVDSFPTCAAVLARYRDGAGPWRAYLPILTQ